ncbi:hypothetical protein GCM10018952_31480 [Streptosporangium vulgare]
MIGGRCDEDVSPTILTARRARAQFHAQSSQRESDLRRRASAERNAARTHTHTQAYQ